MCVRNDFHALFILTVRIIIQNNIVVSYYDICVSERKVMIII